MSFIAPSADALHVLGIYARASNADPHPIRALWKRFHAMGDAAAIEARLNDAVYSVYCEYESDFAGEYTVVIGCEVDAAAAIPEGMKRVEIPAGRFVVIAAEGELPRSVWETWAMVWNSPFDRLYQADYDRYGSDGRVTVHVGVR